MEVSNLTKKRIKDYLEAGKRFDGRGLLDYRDIEIELGISINAEGSARVRIGKTEVVAGVKMDAGTPYTDHEKEGTMMTTLELLPLSSEDFDYGPPKIESIEIARIIDRGIRESRMIDFEKLCIKEGEKVWMIFIDMYSINDDGNLLDACGLAAIAALMSARMPKYNEETERVMFGEFTNKRIPLTKNIPITFTFHKIGKSIILDPAREEEASSEARVSIALSHDGKEVKINAMQKGNETSFTQEEMFDILDMAEKKYKDTQKAIFSKIEKNIKDKE
jgi:exosome complex component RRP42